MDKKEARENRLAYNRTPICLWGESVIFIPLQQYQFMFFAIGKVIRINKGDDFDIVQIQPKPCYKGEVAHLRNIIFAGNHPRRQILTLKCGQFAMFYGRANLVWQEVEKDNGEKKKIRRWHLFAFACQGWYVPKMFDVKKAQEENVEDMYDDLQEGQINFFTDIIEKIEKMNNEGDNDD